MRRKKRVSWRPVCPNQSVSAHHYDRTDFRRTENLKPHIKEQVPRKNLKILKNLNLLILNPYFPMRCLYFVMGSPIFATWTPHLYQQMLGPLVSADAGPVGNSTICRNIATSYNWCESSWLGPHRIPSRISDWYVIVEQIAKGPLILTKQAPPEQYCEFLCPLS